MAVSEETIYREHPCFGPDKQNKGRIHLPVAPGCNIECRFCDRKINKTETEEQFNSFYNNKNNELHDLVNQYDILKKNNDSSLQDCKNKISSLRKEIKVLEGIRIRKENIKNNINQIEKEVINNEHIR